MSCGFRSQQQTPFPPILYSSFSRSPSSSLFPGAIKWDWLPGYLANARRCDSREFSRFKTSSWLHKEDKSRCTTSERQGSQSLAAPGEFVKTAESWTLCGDSYTDDWEGGQEVHCSSQGIRMQVAPCLTLSSWKQLLEPEWRQGSSVGREKWLPSTQGKLAS